MHAWLQEIQACLTIGRTNKDLEEMTQTEIDDFVMVRDEMVRAEARTMVDDYIKDHDIRGITNPENDWVREYLFDDNQELSKQINKLRYPDGENQDEEEEDTHL